MSTPRDPRRPSLSLVHQDDELLQALAERRDGSETADDEALRALAEWVATIDDGLPDDLTPHEPVAPSRRTVILTRAGVAASVATVVAFGGTVAAAATGPGLSGFVAKVERAVERGVAAPRPADPAVLATADQTTRGTNADSARRALTLAKEHLAAGDREGAQAVLSLVEEQVRRNPAALDEVGNALLDDVRQGVAGPSVLAAGPIRAASATSASGGSGPSTGRRSSTGTSRHPGTSTTVPTTTTPGPTSPTTGTRPGTTSPSTPGQGRPTTNRPTSLPTTATGGPTTSPTTVSSPTQSRSRRPSHRPTRTASPSVASSQSVPAARARAAGVRPAVGHEGTGSDR